VRVGSSRDCTDDSITASEQGHVQSVRFTFTKGARELILATVTALSVMTSLWLWSKLHDAEKDIQTQIWLRQDKDEERFQKFIAGPYAELAGEVKATQLLLGTCKEPRK
jgi:hypothetical protein